MFGLKIGSCSGANKMRLVQLDLMMNEDKELHICNMLDAKVYVVGVACV